MTIATDFDYLLTAQDFGLSSADPELQVQYVYMSNGISWIDVWLSEHLGFHYDHLDVSRELFTIANGLELSPEGTRRLTAELSDLLPDEWQGFSIVDDPERGECALLEFTFRSVTVNEDGGPLSMDDVAEIAWPLLGTLMNHFDPGTFNKSYVFADASHGLPLNRDFGKGF